MTYERCPHGEPLGACNACDRLPTFGEWAKSLSFYEHVLRLYDAFAGEDGKDKRGDVPTVVWIYLSGGRARGCYREYASRTEMLADLRQAAIKAGVCRDGSAEQPAAEQPSPQQVGGTHYRDMAIQPVEYITKNKLPFLEGNVVKYISRHRKKDGRRDIEKAIHCLQLLLELEYEKETP